MAKEEEKVFCKDCSFSVENGTHCSLKQKNSNHFTDYTKCKDVGVVCGWFRVKKV